MGQRSDSFDRADSTTSPGTSSSGHAWTEMTGNIGILSNQAYTTSTANNQAFMDSGDSDIDIRVTIAGGAATDRCGVTFRGAATSSHQNSWRLQRHTVSGQIQLLRIEANVITSTDTITATVSTGDVLRVLAIGSTIRCYVNSTLVHTKISSVHSTNTWHGITITEANARLDDWSVVHADAGDADTTTAPVTSYGASLALGPGPGSGGVAAVAGDAAAAQAVNAGLVGQASATAYGATVVTGGAAGQPTTSATASNPSPVVSVPAGTSPVVAEAYDATVSTATATSGQAELSGVSAVAHGVATSLAVSGGLSQGSATAYGATVGVGVGGGHALASVSAQNAKAVLGAASQIVNAAAVAYGAYAMTSGVGQDSLRETVIDREVRLFEVGEESRTHYPAAETRKLEVMPS